MEYYALVAVLAAAVFFDARYHRIPNRLSFAAFLCALLLKGLQEGMGGMLPAVLWAGILFVIFFPFWVFRILGAGDVKIMAVSAVFLEMDTIPFLLCAGGCTALLSLLLMISRRNLFRRLNVFLMYMRGCAAAGKLLPYPFDRSKEKNDGGIVVSYGLLAGHLLALAGRLYGRM